MRYAGPSTSCRQIGPAEIGEQLERILASPDFKSPGRRREFLKYVIAEDAAGRAGGLKGYSIAVAVYGRDTSFDTRIDPLVRIEAGRLRADLEHYYQAAGQNDPLIIEVPKGGNAPRYAWRLEPHPVVDDLPLPVPDETHPGVAATHPSPPGNRSVRLRLAVVSAIAIAALAGILFVSNLAQRPALTTKIASVAVLPFTVQDGDVQQEYFARGLSQELAKNLFQFNALSVIPPNSINLGGQTNPKAFRRSLGTTALIEGSVSKGLDSLRVAVRLIDTATGMLLWGQTYKRPLQADHIADIEDDIAQRVAATIGGISGVLTQSAIEKSLAKDVKSLGALDCVLRFYQHQTKGTAESHSQVRDCLEATTRFEPRYADAWASLSQIYAQEYRVGLNPRMGTRSAIDRSLEAAQRALELSPGDPNALMVRAASMFDAGDFDNFKRMAEASIAARPGEPELLAQYGLRIATHGDWKAGAKIVQSAIDMNQLHHPSWYNIPIVMARYLEDDYVAALSATRGMSRVVFMSADFFAAMIHGQAGRLDLAGQAGERVNRESPNLARQFWPVLRAWKIPEPSLHRFAEGLRKAGVPIDPVTASLNP
jgi:adenylate cyclase